MKRKLFIYGIPVLALLTVVFIFANRQFGKYSEMKKRESAVRDSLVSTDELNSANKEKEKRWFDSMYQHSPGFADSIRKFLYGDQKLATGFPRQIFSGSNYSANGNNAWEELEVKGHWKFEIQYVAGAETNEMHFKIKNSQLMSSVNRNSDWFFHLQMDLAAMKTMSVNSPVDFQTVMKGVSTAQEKYPDKFVTGKMDIEPVQFRGGYLAMERIESDGHYTELSFTIYLDKEEPKHQVPQ